MKNSREVTEVSISSASNTSNAAEIRKRIVEMVRGIEDVWILNVMLRFIEGMTKEGD